MYKFTSNVIGYPPIESGPLAASAGVTPDSGVVVEGVDPVWGWGQFQWARANGAIRQYGLCVLTPTYDTASNSWRNEATECPNTANLGRSVYVAQCVGAMASGDWGWFMRSGVGPVSAAASVAAGVTFGIGGAGQVGANSAGKQVLGAVTVAPSTQTAVSAGSGVINSNLITLQSSAGFFVGMALTGTGVGAGTVAQVYPDGKTIRSSAVNTAAVTGNVTGTATGYIIAQINNGVAQGAIT